MNTLRTFFLFGLIALGAFAVLFPAWLPETPIGPAEDGMVQILQLVLLFVSAAFFFATLPHARRMRPAFRIMGVGALLTALGEMDNLIDPVIAPLKYKWIVLIPIGWMLIEGLRRKKAIRSFTALISRSPATGFFVAGIILIYVFAETFGSQTFWVAALNDPDLGKAKQIARISHEYLELLACYFIFIATTAFCLPITRR